MRFSAGDRLLIRRWIFNRAELRSGTVRRANAHRVVVDMDDGGMYDIDRSTLIEWLKPKAELYRNDTRINV